MIRTTLLLAALATPALAEGEFSEGSEASSWGVVGEEPARFTAEVVDILCHLTGDCVEECGDGARQMGLLREADGALVLVAKNAQPAFTGGAAELAPFCGQTVEVDGNLVGDPELNPAKVYQIQRIRPAGAEEWTRGNRWTEVWAERNPDAGGEGPWFRRDPGIAAMIEKEGYLGLGLETDREFIAEWFQ